MRRAVKLANPNVIIGNGVLKTENQRGQGLGPFSWGRTDTEKRMEKGSQ